jgi:ribonuclease P protein component
MLPRKRRVTRKLFPHVMKQGVLFHSPFTTLRLLKKAAGTESRFSVVVSKQVAQAAVKRNLIKRRVLAIIHTRVKRITPGFDGVFFAKKEILALSFKQIEEVVDSLLSKARIIE